MCDFFSCLWQRGYAPQLGLELAKTRMTLSFYLPASISQFCFFLKIISISSVQGVGGGRERGRKDRELTVWLLNMNFVDDSVGGGPITISKRLDMSRTEMFLPRLLGPLRCHWTFSGHLALPRGS